MTLFKRYAPLFVFFAAMLWATDAPFRLHLTKELSSNFIVLVEHFINLFFAVPLVVAHRKELSRLKMSHWFCIIVIGIGGSALASILFTQAFHYVNPSVAILLQKVQPFVAIILAILLLKEKLPKKFWLWALLSVIGTYFISFPNFVPLSYAGETFNPNLLGVLCAIFAAMLWGACTVFGKYALKAASFELLTGLRFVVGFVFLLILNLSTGELKQVSIATSTDWLFLIIIAIVSGAMSLLIYYRGLQFTKASIATLAELGFVFASLLVNAIFIGVHLENMQIVGIGFLLYAVWKLVKVNRKAENINVLADSFPQEKLS